MRSRLLAILIVGGVAVVGRTAVAATNFDVVNNGMSTWLINGQSNPSLTLLRGQTYTFTIDPAAVGHPFWITTARGAGDVDANQWTQGVTNNGGGPGVVTFVVPVSTPSPLFYQCGFHDTMGGTLTMLGPNRVPSVSRGLLVGLAALLLGVAVAILRRRQKAIAAMRDSDQ
jgi:hypothetical protein